MPHLDMANVPVDLHVCGERNYNIASGDRRERRVVYFYGKVFRYDDLRLGNKEQIAEKKIGSVVGCHSSGTLLQGLRLTAVDAGNGKTYIDPYGSSDWATPQFDENKH